MNPGQLDPDEPATAVTDHEHDDRHRCSCGFALTEGWHLCDRCSRQVIENLDEIAERHRHLSAAPSPQPGRYDQGSSGAPGSRPPARLDITALTDIRSGQSDPVLWRGDDGKQHQESERDTPAVLRAVLGWCQDVADARGITGEPWLPRAVPAPAPPRQGLPRFTMLDHDEMTGAVDWVTEVRCRRHASRAAATDARRRRRQQWMPERVVDCAVSWLARQDDWLARWPGAPDLSAVVRLLRNRLRAACGDPNPRPIGNCIRFVPTPNGEQECGAPIFLPPPRPGIAPAVQCASRHHHEYDGMALLRLKLATEQREEAG